LRLPGNRPGLRLQDGGAGAEKPCAALDLPLRCA
jgi:hypothetical protein